MQIKYLFILLPLIFSLVTMLVYGKLETMDYTTLYGLIIFISVSVGVASGIQIFGSGISSYGVKILFVATSLGAIWVTLIVIAGDCILKFPYGSLILFFLSILYIIGIILNVIDGGGEE